MAEAPVCRWKKRYEGLGVSEIRRLRQVEQQNAQLKQLLADLTLDKAMLQDVSGSGGRVACAKLPYGSTVRRPWGCGTGVVDAA